jgi:hypothetical protein
MRTRFRCISATDLNKVCPSRSSPDLIEVNAFADKDATLAKCKRAGPRPIDGECNLPTSLCAGSADTATTLE